MSSPQNKLSPTHLESSARSYATSSSPDGTSRHSTTTGLSRPGIVGVPQGRGIPEVSELILSCRHHLLLTGVLSIVVATGFAAAGWTMIDASYQAEGLVRVREKQVVILSAQTSRSEDASFFRTQAKLVQSPQVLAKALQGDEVVALAHQMPEGEQAKWLASRLRVHTQSGSEVMSIAVSHPSAKLAQALCNAVTKSYLAEIHHRLLHDRTERKEQLKQAAVQADAQLEASWNQLNRIAEDIGSDSSASLTIRDEIQLQAYREQARQLQAVKLRGNQLQAEFTERQLHRQDDEVEDSEVIESLVQQSPEIRAARSRLMKLEQQINQIEQVAANHDAPRFTQLTDQRKFWVKELQTLVTRSRAAMRQTLQSRSRDQHEKSLALIQQQIELNRSEKDYLGEQLQKMNPVAMPSVRKTAVPLDISRHDVERQQKLADSLWRAIQELEIESQSQPRVTLIDYSPLPEHANHSKQIKAAAVAGSAGWLFIVLAIGFLEWRNCRVRDPDDIIQRTNYPVFGTTSFAGLKMNKGFSLKNMLKVALGRVSVQPSSGVREAAARIILRDQDNGPTPSVMITSCVSSEPRHLVSIETATLLARFRRRVLLIDCDTDHSQLSHVLGASTSVGIRQLPVGTINPTFEAISQLLIATEDDHIDFLPAGIDVGEESWIDPRSLHNTIEAMQNVYDVVIVNGPSIMGSAESVLLAAEVDASIFAVFVNQSRYDHLTLCEKVASDSGIKIGGSILQRGKRRCSLRLQPNRTTRPNRKYPIRQDVVEPLDSPETPVEAETDESNLKREIDELRQELREIQSGTTDLGSGRHDSQKISDTPTQNQDKPTSISEK